MPVSTDFSSGIGLSGGQRARVALARAVYSSARILLLDDPISALDYNTATSVMRNCIAGPLMKDRIVVLSTHRISLVHNYSANFYEVSQGSVHRVVQDPFDDPLDSVEGVSQLEEPADSSALDKGNDDSSTRKFHNEEHREEGGVKGRVWLAFIKAGQHFWILLAAMMILTQILRILQQWFYKAWGEAYGDVQISGQALIQDSGLFRSNVLPTGVTTTDQSIMSTPLISASNIFEPGDYLPSPREDLRPWLTILIVLGVVSSLSLTGYGCSQFAAVYQTSKNLFAQALSRVTHATFRFFDVTPTGRLLNRLTSDIDVLDKALTFFGHTIFFAMLWATSVVVIASISPLFLVLVVLLMTGFGLVFMHFLPTSRDLKRLETVSLSPMYTRFGELLQSQGLITVRAFHAQHSFEESIIATIDDFQGKTHFYWSIQNWLMYRYENISAAAAFGLTAVALFVNLSAGLTAFMLVNAETLIMATHILCLRFGDIQTEFVSVERIVELMEVEQEPPGTLMPPASWPPFGADISLSNVTVRYAAELDPSLKDITLTIPGGKITAVIGRTGSGKSTLASALLNLVRPDAGVISIGNIPLTDVDVNTLRRRVTFIAQDPVLFDGTIHDNLDPIEEYTKLECGDVLARIAASAGQNLDLNDRVESGGRNFSQGQRQLLGIARAVLRRSSIVILDEATASIDVETSTALQKIVREEMQEATVITIAHRAEAVEGVDYVVELEAGRVKRVGKMDDVF